MSHHKLLDKIANWPDHHIWNNAFANRYADKLLDFSINDEIHTVKSRKCISAPSYLRNFGFEKPLNKEAERQIFLKYNYIRYLIHKNRQNKRKVDLTAKLIDDAIAVRNDIADRNNRLILSIAKNHRFNGLSFDEAVSEGSWALLRAIDRFNVKFGWKFSTYMTHAMRKNLFAFVMKKQKQQSKYVLRDCWNIADNHGEPEQPDNLLINECLNELKKFDKRSQSVVTARFGLYGSESQTLDQVGQKMHITKERVRQLAKRTIEKLKIKLHVKSAY